MIRLDTIRIMELLASSLYTRQCLFSGFTARQDFIYWGS